MVRVTADKKREVIYETADQLDISFPKADQLMHRFIVVLADGAKCPQAEVIDMLYRLMRQNFDGFVTLVREIKTDEVDKRYKAIVTDQHNANLMHLLKDLIKIIPNNKIV